jgi:hypothetical protein
MEMAHRFRAKSGADAVRGSGWDGTHKLCRNGQVGAFTEKFGFGV